MDFIFKIWFILQNMFVEERDTDNETGFSTKHIDRMNENVVV